MFWVPSFSGWTAKRFVGERQRIREREGAGARERLSLPPLRSSCGLPGCPTFPHILSFTLARGLTLTDGLLQELTGAVEVGLISILVVIFFTFSSLWKFVLKHVWLSPKTSVS